MMGDTSIGTTRNTTVSSFYIQNTEVTKAEWDLVANWSITHGYNINTNYAQGKASNHPAQNVIWYSAIKWCNAKSEMEGLTPFYYTDSSFTQVYRTGNINVNNNYVNWSANGYRLPTEAEWEYAARAGSQGFNFTWATNNISQSRANYYSCSGTPYDQGPVGYNPAYNNTTPYTSPVGSFAPNAYGLYDMAGNVFEMCWDIYAASYPIGLDVDPHGPLFGQPVRVVRGGSWGGPYPSCAYVEMVFYRSPTALDGPINTMGFRVAKNAVQVMQPPITTNITNCTTISSPGNYVLTQSLIPKSGNSCINISVSNVALDCAGKSIVNRSFGKNGIYASNVINITIKNCNISVGCTGQFGYAIYFNGVNNSLITNNILNNNYWDGIYLDFSSNNTISSNIANNNYYGIWIDDPSSGNKIISNTANNNSWYGIVWSYSSNNILTSNTANNNNWGTLFTASLNNKIISHTANNNNGYGIRIDGYTNLNIINKSINNTILGTSQARGNGIRDIYLDTISYNNSGSLNCTTIESGNINGNNITCYN